MERENEVLHELWAHRGGVSFYAVYVCCPLKQASLQITIVNTLRLHVFGTKVNIGRPTANNNVYVLDEDMKPVAIGEAGRMWAGGAGVSVGYLNLPEKTQERYKPDVFTKNGQAFQLLLQSSAHTRRCRTLMFDTGDFGRWLPDGALEHLGRVDDQVKVKARTYFTTYDFYFLTCRFTGLPRGARWSFRSHANLPSSDAFDRFADRLSALGLCHPRIRRQGCGSWRCFEDPTLLRCTHSAARPGPVSVHRVRCASSSRSRVLMIPRSNGKIDKRALRELASVEREEFRAVTDKENIPPMPLAPAAPHGPLKTADVVVITDIPSAYEGYLAKKALPLSVSESKDTSTSSTTSFKSMPPANSSPSTLEKGTVSWAGYEDEALPEKTQGHYIRNLRHMILTLYRRLFGIVLLTNVGVFIGSLVRGTFQTNHLGLIVVSNLFCAIAMRQDYVINAAFRVFCSVPTS
jgi:hypothetical protein